MMFGKLLTLIGVVMLGIGFYGIFRANQAIPNLNLGNTMALATDAKAREAQLCKEGEKLEEPKGASVYTPGQGYASSVTLYCVNSDGEKREVTGEFANSLLGSVDGIFSGVMSSMMGSLIYFGLVGVGLVVTIIGLLIGRRRSSPIPVSFGVPGGSGTVYTSSTFNAQNPGGGFDLNQVIQQARDMKTAASGDLTTRLKQLEDARNAGLISQTEYDRTRQQILDTLK